MQRLSDPICVGMYTPWSAGRACLERSAIRGSVVRLEGRNTKETYDGDKTRPQDRARSRDPHLHSLHLAVYFRPDYLLPRRSLHTRASAMDDNTALDRRCAD